MVSDCLPVHVGFLYESCPIRRGFYVKIQAIWAGNVRKFCKSLEEYKLQVKKIFALLERRRYNE